MRNLLSVPAYFIIYIGLVIVAMMFFGVGIYPDRLVILLAIPIILSGRFSSFLKDWTPFLLLLFAYEFLRGVIGVENPKVHYLAMPTIDEHIWGVLPTVWLQSHLFNPLSLHWYDYLLTGVYFLHFVAPVLMALVLWQTNRDRFKRFTAAFLLLSYAGLTTYLLFPAAPPWLASQQGLIPHVTKILDQTLDIFPDRLQLPIPTIYQHFDPNVVAAVPSLHSAYPALILFFALRFFKWKGLIVLPYAVAVWVMVIYFGEHYFTDVMLGIIYAAAAFATIEFVWPKLLNYYRNRFHPSDLKAAS